jgi:nucleotide-binding universal stress UspA family protein
LRKCDEWRPDLLVVGSHGRSAIGRFVLGSVSQKVMTEAHCSVRIARARESADTGAPARVLFGFDGSIDAREAARVVASRSWPEKSLVRVLAVLAPSVSESPLFPWTPEQVARREADAREWMQGRLASIELELRSAGLAAEAALTVGAPAQTILEEAEGWGADCLFIGARGLNRLVRFLLGSVATAVAARARCSVEVVRDGRRA